jgi:hypothetical protein
MVLANFQVRVSQHRLHLLIQSEAVVTGHADVRKRYSHVTALLVRILGQEYTLPWPVSKHSGWPMYWADQQRTNVVQTVETSCPGKKTKQKTSFLGRPRVEKGGYRASIDPAMQSG